MSSSEDLTDLEENLESVDNQLMDVSIRSHVSTTPLLLYYLRLGRII